MRLYLSSFRMGNCPERLASLMRGGSRVAVIANATDAYPPEGRAEAVNRELAALSALGFTAEELDLRNHFDDPHVASKLRRYDLIWVRGGDVFILRYSLARQRRRRCSTSAGRARCDCLRGIQRGHLRSRANTSRT